MFNQLKQFNDLRNQANVLRDALAQEIIEYEKHGIKITMNGNMEVAEVTINSDASHEQMAKTLVIVINEAIKRTQLIMAKKMRSMGGIPGFN